MLLLIFLFFLTNRPTFVQGHSMYPTLNDGDIMLCNTLITPKVGDIVVVKPMVITGGKYIIKRITDIKDDEIFVEGDNKDFSFDSRSFGYIPQDRILGVVY